MNIKLPESCFCPKGAVRGADSLLLVLQVSCTDLTVAGRVWETFTLFYVFSPFFFFFAILLYVSLSLDNELSFE